MTRLHDTWRFLFVCSFSVLVCSPALAAEYIEASVDSQIVPGPVEFAVLLPDGYDQSGDPYPLLLNLHGGRGSRDVLKRQRPIFEQMWQDGSLAKMVVVTPSVTPRCFYMDYRDGSQKWETFLVGEFLEHLRTEYHVRRDKSGTMLSGISMANMHGLMDSRTKVGGPA